MTRTVRAVAGAVVLLASVAACGGGSPADAACTSASSVDTAVASGAPSAHAALQRLIAGHATWMNTDGWQLTSRASGANVTVTYTSGTDSATFVRDDRNRRWYLDAYRNCR
jgi:hypothetical protein